MSYNTPELLLVGEAQNFVLGFSDVKGLDQNIDDGSCPTPTYDLFREFEVCW